MPEQQTVEPAAPATPVTPPTTPQTPAEPILAPIVGPDGKFAEGWRDRVSEQFRNEPCLDLIGDQFDTMVKNYVYTQKMRGKNTVVVPNEKSDPTEWDQFYAAVGRPTLASEYEVKRPEGFPEELWDSNQLDQFKDKAWELGLTAKQVAALIEFDSTRTLNVVAQQKEAAEAARAEAEKALRAEWKDAYDEQLHLANAFIAKTVKDEDQKAAILDIAGNNPAFIKWVAEWGMKTAESHGIDTSQFKTTPQQSQDRLAELMATPGYISGELKRTDPARHERVQKEITELNQQLYAS